MVAFFPNWKGQRIKIGKWLTILTILLLCVFQLYTLSEIYQNTKKDYSNNIFSILVAKTELLNLIKLPSPPQTYYSYNANRHKLRIIKENERIDSIFKLEPNRDFRLVNCQASYDIRDTNIWTLDTLGKMLVTALESQILLQSM